MLSKLNICICLLFVLPGLFFITSCSKKAMHVEQMNEEVPPVMDANTIDQEQVAASEEHHGEAIYNAQQVFEKEETQDVEMTAEVFMKEDIYFDFDSSVLKNSAKTSLIIKAEWLRMYPDAFVIIEGHCDERGTSAYNIALGDRRAQSAMSFFADIGIDTNQISIVSYGEERPVDVSQTEEAWAKNRRAHFVIN